METLYSIGDIEYTLYQAASNDWCVTVSKPFKPEETYNLGSKENALEFILEPYVLDIPEEED